MERALTRIINQAVLEQNENMRRKDKPDEFVSFLLPIVRKYISTVFAPIMAVTPGGEKPEVYTEYSFSFFVDASERAAFIDKFGKYLKHADREGGIPSGCKIWVNGQADLVVKQADNTIKVYDYKSDAMRGKPLQEFEASCAAKYEGQLALYRYAVGKSFGVKPDDVKTELVNLYR